MTDVAQHKYEIHFDNGSRKRMEFLSEERLRPMLHV